MTKSKLCEGFNGSMYVDFKQEMLPLMDECNQTMIKKDVYWQSSEPVDCSSGLSRSLSKSYNSMENLIEEEILSNDNKDNIIMSQVEPFDFQDNRSSTSDDSTESVNSIDESYTLTITQTKQKRIQNTSRRKIDPVYCNDPFLQRHRLMVNARQKGRMLKINSMYTLLNDVIPTDIPCQQNVKPQSKLGILRRAIMYWNSLQDTLVEPNIHTNIHTNIPSTNIPSTKIEHADI